MPRTVDKKKCLFCGSCADVCPSESVHFNPEGDAVINRKSCLDCGECQRICPGEAISEVN